MEPTGSPQLKVGPPQHLPRQGLVIMEQIGLPQLKAVPVPSLQLMGMSIILRGMSGKQQLKIPIIWDQPKPQRRQLRKDLVIMEQIGLPQSKVAPVPSLQLMDMSIILRGMSGKQQLRISIIWDQPEIQQRQQLKGLTIQTEVGKQRLKMLTM